MQKGLDLTALVSILGVGCSGTVPTIAPGTHVGGGGKKCAGTYIIDGWIDGICE